jgi:AraC-like DNA-binding protein
MNMKDARDMILVRHPRLKLGLIKEIGIDNIKKASPQKTQRHRHIQLTFMLKGSLSWISSSGKAIHLNGGEYCVTTHGNTFETSYDVFSPCSLMWIIFDPCAKNAEHYEFFNSKELSEINNSLKNASNSTHKINQTMHFYIRNLRELLIKTDKKKICRADMLRIRVLLMGILVESSNSSKEIKKQTTIDLCPQVRRLILEQPERNLQVKDIADFFMLSPNFFGKKFRAESGMSVADFARRVKLEEAIRLMCEESKNITETAFSLGFSSTQYFATIFKKYFGCAPNQFKAKSQK